MRNVKVMLKAFFIVYNLKRCCIFTSRNKQKLNNMKNKVKALVQYLDCKKKEIIQYPYSKNCFEYENEEYLVVTDEEADELWEESLDRYLEDCIYPELPQNMLKYFDDEAWKNDARYDGRGHSLNYYDGSEEEEEVEGETYYIYRQN